MHEINKLVSVLTSVQDNLQHQQMECAKMPAYGQRPPSTNESEVRKDCLEGHVRFVQLRLERMRVCASCEENADRISTMWVPPTSHIQLIKMVLLALLTLRLRYLHTARPLEARRVVSRYVYMGFSLSISNVR